MGNHAVGRAMVAVAEVAAERRKPGESAIDILDEAAERSEIRGMDAEFDDAIMPGEPMFDLIIEAFANGETFNLEDDDNEDEWDRFYEGPYNAFRERYNLC